MSSSDTRTTTSQTRFRHELQIIHQRSEGLVRRIRHNPRIRFFRLNGRALPVVPDIELIISFSEDAFVSQTRLHDPQFDSLLNEVVSVLEQEEKIDWSVIQALEATIKRECKTFRVTWVVVTDKSREEQIRNSTPMVITETVKGFTSDEEFLRELGISPEVCPLTNRDHRVLASMGIMPCDFPPVKLLH